MPKFVFLSRYYLSNKGSLKIKFICEIAIFIVVLALASSVISIYYESKLAKHSNELVKLEIQEHTIQEWLTDAPERNLENRLGKFLYRLIENNENFDLNKKRYYFYLLAWYPETIKFAIKDMNLIENKELKKKYNFLKIKKENNEVFDFIYNIFDKINYPDEWIDNKNTDKYFVNIQETTLKKLLDTCENNIFQINLFFREYNNITDSKKKILLEKIDSVDKKSKETMLIAFFFQLLIFFIVQFLEIREIKSAKKNLK